MQMISLIDVEATTQHFILSIILSLRNKKFGFLVLFIYLFFQKTTLRYVSGFLLHQTSWTEFAKLELLVLKITKSTRPKSLNYCSKLFTKTSLLQSHSDHGHFFQQIISILRLKTVIKSSVNLNYFVLPFFCNF